MLRSTQIDLLEIESNCINETCSISGCSTNSDNTQNVSPSSSETDLILSDSDFNINNLNLHSDSYESISSLNENLKSIKPEIDVNTTTNYLTHNNILEREAVLRFINYAADHHWLKRNESIDEKALIRKFELFKIFNPSFSISNVSEDSNLLNDIRKADLLKEDIIDENHNVMVKFKNHIFHNTSKSAMEERTNIPYSRNKSKSNFLKSELKCTMCKKVFQSESESKEHNISELHILNHLYRNDRKWFFTKLFYFEPNESINMKLCVNETKEIEIIFKNIADNPTIVEVKEIFELVILNEIKIEYLVGSPINNGNIFKLKLTARFSQEGAKIYPLVLKLSRSNSEKLDYLLFEPKFNVYQKSSKNNNNQENSRNFNKNFAIGIQEPRYNQINPKFHHKHSKLNYNLLKPIKPLMHDEVCRELPTEQGFKIISAKIKEQHMKEVTSSRQNLNYDRFRRRDKSSIRAETHNEPHIAQRSGIISYKTKEKQLTAVLPHPDLNRDLLGPRSNSQNGSISGQKSRMIPSWKAKEVNKIDGCLSFLKRSDSVSTVLSERISWGQSHERVNVPKRSASCEIINTSCLKQFNSDKHKQKSNIKIRDHCIPKHLKISLKTFKASSFNLIPNNPSLKELFFDEITETMIPNETGLNISNYCKRFQYLLWIEEFKADEELHSYDKKGIRIITDRRHRGLYGIKLESLSEGRPSVLKGDNIFISVSRTSDSYNAEIKEVEKEPFDRNFKQKRYNITFILNRSIMNLSHHFLNHMSNLVLRNVFFPTKCDKQPLSVELKPFFNDSIASNELQSQAIKNIIQNTAFPAPYILFGPPGTGKTATFIEAIVQVWSIFENAHICVCASSNTASDVIAERLMSYLPNNEIMRIYGLSRSSVGCSNKFEPFSNYNRLKNKKGGTTFFPDIDEFVKRRVVIMTPVMAGKVIIRLMPFMPQFFKFDYLFIDEASHTLESDLLIPICAFSEKNPNGRIILAGDPKQLGPVVRSSIASELGFGMSYMERLMKNCELYKKDSITSQYNPKVITKLVNNYRSHENILFTSNHLFYENELQIKASTKIIVEFCSWHELPTLNFPIIFHSVKGEELQEKDSPSYFNLKEIEVIENYLEKLFDSESNKFSINDKDIGIISPYKQQVIKIRTKLSKNHKFKEIAVASVEEFQGQEKKIILISTVRSRFELIPSDYKFGLGFLRNEKRLNVALSRAMALLIVIGNPDILQCDTHWKFFLDFCIKNGSYVGEAPCPLSDSDENVVKNV